ncbi:MAG: TIR domain-containing protein [Prevotellaceae bacterium]|jgi:hypothetical protein|nr:TIR domain-containing protein [Prevotellaceae bacterium]
MGKKIFISYKYADRLVRQFQGTSIWSPTTVRDYVDILQNKIDKSDHINKGENDGEDMSSLADSTIGSKLGDKIFDSSVTIVFISKGMKENKPEKDQWIPWEISYSLREQSRQYGNSKTNAVLAVVLPAENGSYDYYFQYNPECNSTTHKTNQLFTILRENMFNIKNPTTRLCNGSTIYEGESSFIKTVEWDKFINNINFHIEQAVEIWRHRDDYNIRKSV